MNLLTEPWLPVERASGRLDWIAPHQITETDDPPQRLAAMRPDFNGSLMQFLIGLVQTTTAVDSNRAWERAFEAPPTPDQLQEQFATFASAFEFDGEGARFMQDMSIIANQAASKPIEQLLIDAAMENTTKKNIDLFVKRAPGRKFCKCCSAAALYTLQVNAPSGGGGGGGHFTSIRGGGPLTTLVVFSPKSVLSSESFSLWKSVWLNVMRKAMFDNATGNSHLGLMKHRFPWVENIENVRIAGRKFETEHGHAAHAYWSMPRRILLNTAQSATSTCDICGRQVEALVDGFLMQTVGIDYGETWRHPLSPYYRLKPGEPALPLHPQPGGLGYRHWLAWVLGSSDGKKNIEPAAVVSRFLDDIHESGQYRLWAFGFDMDNMKARCWYESTLPLYTLAATGDSRALARRQSKLQFGLGQMVAAAELTVYFARSAIRSAWFGEIESKGDMSFIDAAFWSDTESAFYHGLQQWLALVQVDVESMDAEVRIKTEWLNVLRKAAKALFEHHAETGQIGAGNPHRIAEAHRQLSRNLHGPKLLDTLGLQPADKPKGKTVRKKQQEQKA